MVSASRASAEADTGTVRSEAPERLVTDSDGVPVAWTLQVATVSSAEKAEKLRKELLAMNHKAYVTAVRSGGKSLFRVSVGPKFERVELEKLQTNINAEFGVTSMVVRYIP
jgi:DedD protein